MRSVPDGHPVAAAQSVTPSSPLDKQLRQRARTAERHSGHLCGAPRFSLRVAGAAALHGREQRAGVLLAVLPADPVRRAGGGSDEHLWQSAWEE